MSTLEQVPGLDGGTILLVNYGPGDNDYSYVEAAHLEEQAGRVFLVGTCFDFTGSAEMSGLRVSIAWEAVTSYYVFTSPDHCRDAVKNWGTSSKGSWFSRS